jgi:hypothetical protein
LKINKRKHRSLKKSELRSSVIGLPAFNLLGKAWSGLSEMILIKVRFENQQKKTPLTKKKRASVIGLPAFNLLGKAWSGLSAMILIKVRFENHQKKTLLTKKTK